MWRELQCLVAIDLKMDDFKPEYMGKMLKRMSLNIL